MKGKEGVTYIALRVGQVYFLMSHLIERVRKAFLSQALVLTFRSPHHTTGLVFSNFLRYAKKSLSQDCVRYCNLRINKYKYKNK